MFEFSISFKRGQCLVPKFKEGGGEDKYKSKGKGGQPHVLKVGKSISRLEGGWDDKSTP